MRRKNSKRNRLRIFAGPNGSGKSTILEQIDFRFDIGYYINADEIEKILKSEGKIGLSDFGIEKFSKSKFDRIVKSHSIVKKANDEGYKIDLILKGNTIVNPNKESHSYEAAFLADVLRKELMESGKKITFETVMSHPSKIKFLKQAKRRGYKVYLYFVSTESPIININRVEQRVILGGHPVREDKIESRYYKSLKLLKEAIKVAYRSFIFDNSGMENKLILEIFKGEKITFHQSEIPKWIEKYVLK